MKLWLGLVYILFLLSLTSSKGSIKSAKHKAKKNQKSKSRSAPFIGGGTPLFDLFDAEYVVGMVRLYEEYHECFCAAVIIADLWALSALPCINNKTTDYEIITGKVVLRGGTSYIQGNGGFDHRIATYDQVMFTAVIRVKNSFSNYPYERPISLIASKHYVYGSNRAEVFGWGESFYQGTGSETLKVAEVLLMTNKKCNEYYPMNENSLETVCATNVTGFPCGADVGGPLIRGNVLLGILLYSPCTDLPGVYARISSTDGELDHLVGKGKLQYSPPRPKLN